MELPGIMLFQAVRISFTACNFLMLCFFL